MKAYTKVASTEDSQAESSAVSMVEKKVAEMDMMSVASMENL